MKRSCFVLIGWIALAGEGFAQYGPRGPSSGGYGPRGPNIPSVPQPYTPPNYNPPNYNRTQPSVPFGPNDPRSPNFRPGGNPYQNPAMPTVPATPHYEYVWETRCTGCNRVVSNSSTPGQHCPHCGVLWTSGNGTGGGGLRADKQLKELGTWLTSPVTLIGGAVVIGAVGVLVIVRKIYGQRELPAAHSYAGNYKPGSGIDSWYGQQKPPPLPPRNPS